MIKAPPAPTNIREYSAKVMEHMVYDLDAKILGKERCKLRPHGRSAWATLQIHYMGRNSTWWNGDRTEYDTRAQAAQAAYANS